MDSIKLSSSKTYCIEAGAINFNTYGIHSDVFEIETKEEPPKATLAVIRDIGFLLDCVQVGYAMCLTDGYFWYIQMSECLKAIGPKINKLSKRNASIKAMTDTIKSSYEERVKGDMETVWVYLRNVKSIGPKICEMGEEIMSLYEYPDQISYPEAKTTIENFLENLILILSCDLFKTNPNEFSSNILEEIIQKTTNQTFDQKEKPYEESEHRFKLYWTKMLQTKKLKSKKVECETAIIELDEMIQEVEAKLRQQYFTKHKVPDRIRDVESEFQTKRKEIENTIGLSKEELLDDIQERKEACEQMIEEFEEESRQLREKKLVLKEELCQHHRRMIEIYKPLEEIEKQVKGTETQLKEIETQLEKF